MHMLNCDCTTLVRSSKTYARSRREVCAKQEFYTSTLDSDRMMRNRDIFHNQVTLFPPPTQSMTHLSQIHTHGQIPKAFSSTKSVQFCLILTQHRQENPITKHYRFLLINTYKCNNLAE